MFKFFKLFGEQYFGFWIGGLLLFAVQEIPYMIMPLIKPDPNPIMNIKEHYQPLAVAEAVLGTACIVLMCSVVREGETIFSVGEGAKRVFFFLACAVLLANFIGWAVYYAGTRTDFVMLTFIVAMPPLYYLFTGLWRGNTPLTVTAAVFLCVHFSHVFLNLRQGG